MLSNYFKIAWRNIVKHPFYSLVNIIGLAAGIAFTIMIMAYVTSELQVNRQLKNADQQYIIQSNWKNQGMGFELATLGPLAKELKRQYPDLVENYYRYDGITSNVSKGDKSFREGLQVGDSTMLSMYGFHLLQGNPVTAFNGPFSLVITSNVAKKYFGKTGVLGQTLTIENFSGSKHDFLITGVLENIPRNSITRLVDEYPNSFFISSDNLSYFGRNMDWTNTSIASFIELKQGVKPQDLEKPIQHLVKQNTSSQVVENLTPFLVPLKKYYLQADGGIVKKMLFTLSAIALFILGMAVINFVNMSISRSATRMREIGIRKVLGGLKRQLIIQFLSESFVIVFIATLISLCIYVAGRDLFMQMTGKEIPTLTSFPVYLALFPCLLILLVGFIAGIYPAFVLASLKSVASLKGEVGSIKENQLLRKSLVAFQFATASIVLIGAFIISQQIHLFFSDNLGYNKNLIVSAQVPRDWSPEGVKKMESLRNRFAASPQVGQVTLSYEIPDGNNSGSAQIFNAGADSTTALSFTALFSDEYYAQAYSIPMAAGLFYGKPGAITDSSKIVINETGANALGYKTADEAIGKQIRFPGGADNFEISGVTKDFHFGSMQKAIPPVAFLQVKLTTTYRYLTFKMKGNLAQSMAALQKQWSALLPGTPFEYKFMDETLARLYKTEIQLEKASYTATGLSLIIALLGVLGLISLSVQKRRKEIGIRKVLGSSIPAIIVLFMKEFLGSILIASVIACPVAYFLMRNWLSDYAYKIQMTFTPFITSIILLTIVTGILILLQTIKTALANPVKSLRTE